MGRMCNCIVCLDSGYLAVHKDDESIVVPMCDLSGSQLSDYRLVKCRCKEQVEAASKMHTGCTRKFQNWQPENETQSSTSQEQMKM